jgi:nucleoside-diphosphate-sugar epimerase
MRVVVTGASGFLGTPTVAALAEYGAQVVSVSRHGTLDDSLSLRVDITDPSTWPALLTPVRPDRLIHLAWGYLGDFNDPRHYLELLPAHLRFLAWCVRNSITDITVAGTCFEYGLAEGRMIEEMAAQPVTAYGIAKDSLRRAMEHLACTVPFSLKWARVFFVRGDDVQEKGVFRLIRQAAERGDSSFPLSWGEQLRDYLPRDQVGRFLARFCLQNGVQGVVNCCSGVPLSMRRMIEEYSRQWPGMRLEFGKVPYRSYEPMAFWGSRERMDAVMRSAVDVGTMATK